MTNSLTIVGRVRKASQNLESSIAFLSESQKDICSLSRELINEANDLTNLRKPYTGKHVRELDKFLEGVIRGFGAIHSEVQVLIPKQDELKGPLERAFNWGKSFYTVDSVKKKILYLLERVRDTQQKFLTKNVALTTLDPKDVRESATQMKAGISLLVQTAENEANEAKRIFGIDQMTAAQRKAALHKTALDVAVTANDEHLLLMALKTRTLMSALASDLRGLEKDVFDEPKQAYEEKTLDPFRDANSDPCRAWRRHDALIETITFLDILRSPESLLATPAIVLLVRANRICQSLHSLGLQAEALQLCLMAHEALQDLSSSNPAFYHGYLADSVVTLLVCYGTGSKLDLAANEKLVKTYRALDKVKPNSYAKLLANSLHDLSFRLGDAGRKDDAVAAIQESVTICRTLAKTNSDQYKPALVWYLTVLYKYLEETDKTEDALVVIEESVAMYRVLAETNADAFTSYLAFALHNLSRALSNIGKNGQALVAIQETVEIRRALAKANPESHLTVQDLANALNSLSYRLSDLGRREEALVAILEPVETFRVLAKTDPDTFNPELANCVDSLSVHLAGAGKTEEAVCASKEAVEMYRVLVDKDRDAFNLGYVEHLRNLAKHLTKAGESAAALAAAVESVAICKTLAKDHPEAFDRELALSLNVLSICQRATGKRSEALALAEEAVAINRELVKTNPGGSNPKLAESLHTVSICLRDSGRTLDALAAIEESVEILGRLYDQHPEFFQSLLADALDVCLDCRQAAGKANETHDTEEEAGQIPN